MPNLRMPSENCSIFNCYSYRAALGILFFRIPTNDHKIKLEEQHCCSCYSCVDGDLKRKIKNQSLHTSRQFLLTKIFQFGQKLLELLPTLLFNTHRVQVGNKFHYAGLYIKRTNTSLFLIRDTLSTLNLPIKIHQSATQLFYLV